MIIYKKSQKGLTSGPLKGFTSTPKNFAGSSPSKRGFSRLIARRRITSGFTLLELLVVISIIGILSSIILSSFNEAKAKSRLARAQGIMANIVPILNICSLDEKTLRNPNNCPQAICSVNCENPDSPPWPTIPTTGGWSYTIRIPTTAEMPGNCVTGGPGGSTCYCDFTSAPPYEICARGNTVNPNQKYGIKCTLLGCKSFSYTCVGGVCSQP